MFNVKKKALRKGRELWFVFFSTAVINKLAYSEKQYRIADVPATRKAQWISIFFLRICGIFEQECLQQNCVCKTSKKEKKVEISRKLWLALPQATGFGCYEITIINMMMVMMIMIII